MAASVCDAALAHGARVSAVAWHVDGPVLAATGSRWDLLDWWSSVRDTVLPDPARFGGLVARRLRSGRPAGRRAAGRGRRLAVGGGRLTAPASGCGPVAVAP